MTILGAVLAPLPVPPGRSPSRRQLFLHWRIGWLKGLLYRLCLRLRSRITGSGYSCGRGLSVQGRLRVRGPGCVEIGEFVTISNRTDLYTHTRDAKIIIGNGCFLNGARFGCAERIEIGDQCILADVRIMDTDFHSLYRERHNFEAPVLTRVVKIGKNVWIAAQAAVLKGVTIGSNSVIGFGSVVSRDIPADTIAAGNPCVSVGAVQSMTAGSIKFPGGLNLVTGPELHQNSEKVSI